MIIIRNVFGFGFTINGREVVADHDKTTLLVLLSFKRPSLSTRRMEVMKRSEIHYLYITIYIVLLHYRLARHKNENISLPLTRVFDALSLFQI